MDGAAGGRGRRRSRRLREDEVRLLLRFPLPPRPWRVDYGDDDDPVLGGRGGSGAVEGRSDGSCGQLRGAHR